MLWISDLHWTTLHSHGCWGWGRLPCCAWDCTADRQWEVWEDSGWAGDPGQVWRAGGGGAGSGWAGTRRLPGSGSGGRRCPAQCPPSSSPLQTTEQNKPQRSLLRSNLASSNNLSWNFHLINWASAYEENLNSFSISSLLFCVNSFYWVSLGGLLFSIKVNCYLSRTSSATDSRDQSSSTTCQESLLSKGWQTILIFFIYYFYFIKMLYCVA